MNAIWDDKVKVWVASSSDLPGFNTEVDTAEQLIEKLTVMIPELIELNRWDANTPELKFCVKIERRVIAHTQIST